MGLTYPQSTARYQQDLFTTVHGSASTTSIEVLVASISQLGSPSANLFPNVSAYPDLGNVHSYQGGGPPLHNLLTKDIRAEDKIVGTTKRIVATETGYHTLVEPARATVLESQPNIDEYAHGRYVPRLYLDYFNVPRISPATNERGIRLWRAVGRARCAARAPDADRGPRRVAPARARGACGRRLAKVMPSPTRGRRTAPHRSSRCRSVVRRATQGVERHRCFTCLITPPTRICERSIRRRWHACAIVSRH